MFNSINRNNRLFMLSNFVFALCYGLWMNLRQLHLGDLGATPGELGAVLGMVAIAGGILPVPAGLLTDRFGPKRVILGAWGIAVIGTLLAASATTWPLAGVGFAVFMLVIAANPATVAFVLLNTPGQDQQGQAERVMATVFASWPAAMIFAPALGGLVADRMGIAANLWIAVAGFVVASAIFMQVEDARPVRSESRGNIRAVLNNRSFVALAIFYPLALIAINVGFTLLPTYVEGVRGYSPGPIGALFSILSAGSLAFNYVIGKLRSEVSFVVLISAVWLGILIIYQTDHTLFTVVAFALLGAISTLWLLAQTSFGQLVSQQQRGLALGITESLAYGAVALSSWLAGQLYEYTPAHDLPMLVGLLTMPLALAGWLILPLRRTPDFRQPAASSPAK